MSTYVVQRQDGEHWNDLATVEVPQRTKRKTIIEKALEEAQHIPAVGARIAVRVLDGPSSEVLYVTAEEQPPRLKVG
jgi:hypothetical protein